MSSIFVVGLTGPTGAGKTIVAELIKEHGIPSVDADVIAHYVTEKDSRGLYELSLAFGKEILLPDGTLNRAELAKRAFADKEKLKILNDITHPLIIMEIRRQIKALCNKGEKIAALDAALLFESGVDILCNDTVAVIAEKSIRKERIKARDSISDEAAEKRIAAQNSDEYYLARANHIIRNNGNIEELTSDLVRIVAEIEKEVKIRRG